MADDNDIWIGFGHFMVAFAITLGALFSLPHNWFRVYEQLRQQRLARRKGKSRRDRTVMSFIYGGLDAAWWVPVLIYFVCVVCAVLGIVFFQHAGYVWNGAAVPEENQPLIFLGFWFVILLMSWWLVDFLRPTVDQNAPHFWRVLGCLVMHLGVWIAMVVLAPGNAGGWFQIPLFIAIVLIFIFTSLAFIRNNGRYVIMMPKTVDCKKTRMVAIAPGCAHGD